MIQATGNGFNASVAGPVVYLDNWAIYDLAEEDASRRRRFIQSVHSGIDVLFSVTNAVELSGPQGRSAEMVRVFLDEIGPRWFPVQLNPITVMNREKAGEDPERIFVAEDFFKEFLVRQANAFKPGDAKIIDSSDLVLLGGVLDWVGPQRQSIAAQSKKFDELLVTKLAQMRVALENDRNLLDERLPIVPFDPTRPACFVWDNLLRTLAIEGGPIKKGDGFDFCHALMASAYASFATLDTAWKARVERLPKPNGLAPVYSRPQLNDLVADMESWVVQNGV